VNTLMPLRFCVTKTTKSGLKVDTLVTRKP
jgi:hypothetical protein